MQNIARHRGRRFSFNAWNLRDPALESSAGHLPGSRGRGPAWLRILFAPILFLACATMEHAVGRPDQKPGTVEKAGTVYLNDPALLRETPMLLPTPKPTPTPTPRPKATPVPVEKPSRLADEQEGPHIPAGSLRTSRITQASEPISPGRSVRRTDEAVMISPHGSGLTVETMVPYPTQYAPAQVSSSRWGNSVVVPATPTRFAESPVGTSFDGNNFRSREFQGFINYGSPIRTFAPVYDSQGRPVGMQVFETPNPVLQPVFRTIEIRR